MKKILVIEDEVGIKELYTRVLSGAGHQVFDCEDGETGLKLAKEHLPDLILLDVMLPRLNGLEVLKALKKDAATKAIPVVLITNLGQENIILNAFKLGAQGYFLKLRITPDQLAIEIEKFLIDPTFRMDPYTLVFD